MCSPARCRVCGRTTWSGCGQHVDQVMARIPVAERCGCTDADREAWRRERGSFLSRLFGR